MARSEGHGMSPDVAQRECCRTPRSQLVVPLNSVLLWPHSHARALASLTAAVARDIDFSFIGSLGGDPTTARNRQWVLSFALKYFTNRSYFVDTSVTRGDAVSYVPRGPWDHSASHKGWRPKSEEEASCERARCDGAYYSYLARSQLVLAPAGDAPWSQRFFEAAMAGAIPVVSDTAHTGRNAVERALGYHYLLAPELEELYLRRGISPPNCANWQSRNMHIFRTRQTMAHGEQQKESAETVGTTLSLTSLGCM
jgi:hypothetical protein